VTYPDVDRSKERLWRVYEDLGSTSSSGCRTADAYGSGCDGTMKGTALAGP